MKARPVRFEVWWDGERWAWRVTEGRVPFVGFVGWRIVVEGVAASPMAALNIAEPWLRGDARN